ncbi:MAG: hypothetical protein HN929_12700 [Chloroflexi bacterium]|jgi:hypothetical protein|nr:hypothetical protein [Chloroflexota bacterium]
MTHQQQIDRDQRVDEMIKAKYNGVSFPAPGVCTAYWDVEDWAKWIENHRTDGFGFLHQSIKKSI